MRPANITLTPLSDGDIRRFWSKVAIGQPDECWLWTAGKCLGRGAFWLHGSTVKAPRVAYYLSTSVDPGELMVCHECNVAACCNPKHLYLGQEIDNTRDRIIAGTQVRGEKQGGSKLTENNVLLIRKLYQIGDESQRSLAKQFGVSQHAIKCIVLGRTWRHVA